MTVKYPSDKLFEVQDHSCFPILLLCLVLSEILKNCFTVAHSSNVKMAVVFLKMFLGPLCFRLKMVPSAH